MNSKQLEYFVSLAETLNFTKTAQKFFISQTAVTKQKIRTNFRYQTVQQE